ncbi:hypothetical protein Tco_0651923 [Tanacetum coccineum]|uniref:Uncharacterized protein n=1 Tax=Tanacetum coccineum TaxID=301880 RepID=A0ABQ4WW56_9ASTR
MALLPPGFLEPLYPDMINNQDIEHMISPTPPRDIEPPHLNSPIPIYLHLHQWLDNQYGSYPATNGIETSPRENLMSQHACYDVFISGRMAPKRTSTSAAPAMTQAAIRKLVAVE